MNLFMTPQQRVMAVLRHETPDCIPFTAYENKVHRCSTERVLRNRGMCIVARTTSYDIHYPNVLITTHGYKDARGKNIIKTTYETPVGTLTDLAEPAGFTTWKHERVFKSPDDYKALLFMIKDATVTPQYARAAKLQQDLGEDFLVRDWISHEPLQIMQSEYMGIENFCLEWMENRDDVLKLYDAVIELNRVLYKVVAEGPLETANYGGNVTPSVIGKNVFREYYMPHYHEFTEEMHKYRKYVGVHFDADNMLIMNDIAETELDYIEAYDAGMSPPIGKAKEIFGNKVLWINWPSAWHLYDPEEVRHRTVELLCESGGDNIIVGITEDVPEDRWRLNFSAIMDGIEDYHERREHIT